MSTDSSSCDSELAEIVAAVRKGCRPEVADALLRMVEDLILQRNTLVDLKDATSRVNIRLRKERDDLRANLETAEHNSKSWETAAKEWGDKCDDLRAKLETATQAALDTLARNEELETKLAQSEEWGKLLIERWTAEVQHARKLQDKLEADDPTDG